MKYKIVFLAVMIFVFPLVSAAEVIDINYSASDMVVGKVLEYNNYKFIVKGIEKVYFNPNDGTNVQIRIFVENVDRNDALENEISGIEKSISNSRNYTSFLNGMLNRLMVSEQSLSERMKSIANETGFLIEENSSSAASLEKISQEKSALENELDGKFLLTKGQSVLLLIVFAILIMSVVVIETKAYFSRK